jgi:thiopeptide-type bacteriocin biosynthesis protein
MYVPVRSFLLRAPLLPEAALKDPVRKLQKHALGRRAVELASPGLQATPAGRRRLIVERYARRAAFRATPYGLLAGVCVGELGARTRVATGAPSAYVAPTWARVAALGRALLERPDLRAAVRLRAAPSLAREPGLARWLGLGETIRPWDPGRVPNPPRDGLRSAEPSSVHAFGELREAEVDARLGAILDLTAAGWTPWPAVRASCAAGDDVEADELILILVDDGLLHTDLEPPLVGPAPADWMKARLASLGLAHEAVELDAVGDARESQAVLVHGPARTPTLARAEVERAAALVPLLHRLQEALAPPAAERLAQPALLDALDASTEIFGAGALDLEALATGGYGVETSDGGDSSPAAPSPPAALLATIVDAIMAAVAAGQDEAALEASALAAALGATGPAPPPTCELFLTPAPAGVPWLLGLHAPAGASWGRFAAALGPPLERALAELAAAEATARPFEEWVDVAYAPSPGLADLCTHPRVRRRTLALSGFSDRAQDDLRLCDLELVADPNAARPLALRDRSQRPLVPAPLARVRSSTAPAGILRLLAGWSLARQHAPWALALGPLAGLERVPRLSLDRFVVAPASWRIPAAVASGRAGRAAIDRWRRAGQVPRWIQVGDGDELLPVDLDAAGAAAELRGRDRAWEIWPPLGQTVDADGRRLEAVVALIDQPDDADAAASEREAARASATAGTVPPPRLAPPLPGWRAFKLFGPEDRQDELLTGAVAPAIHDARAAGEIDRWFFLRYVDGPGRRPHLRVRISSPAPAAFEARLAQALAPARAGGLVASVESGDYFPERARWGGDRVLYAAHALFESDSEAALAVVANESTPIRLGRLVQSMDALARGFGLDPDAREALAAERRRAATAGHTPAPRAEGRTARLLLRAPPDDAATRAIEAHAGRVAAAAAELSPSSRAVLMPALLHLAAVRLLGLDAEAEAEAYALWERALAGLRHAPLGAADGS